MNLPDLSAAIEFLEEGDDFLITSHVNSDGDSVAGSLAMRHLLEALGKHGRVVLADIPEDHYDFLAGFAEIHRADGAPDGLGVSAVVLDCPNLDRIGDVRRHLREDARLLNIDHHKDNAGFGSVNIVCEDVSSTSELIYHLALAMGVPIDRSLAEQLYTGILYDTGSFRYSLTTPTSLEVAAALVRAGARLDVVADRIYNSSCLDSVKLIGRAIDSLELYFDGRLACLHLDHEAIRKGDPEEAVNYGLKIKGVLVSIFMKEARPAYFRISLRSRGDIDVSAVAADFGGGGHARASGCELEGSAAQVRTALLEKFSPLLT